MTKPARPILAVCGSLQADSSNLRLLRRAANLELSGLAISIADHLRSLPLFNPDLLDQKVPEAVGEWRAALASCEGLLIACPEYGHSLPGALKNGIDWVIGTGELYGKVVATTASVRDPRRGRLGLGALKQTLLAVDARVVWDEPVVAGDESDAQLKKLLQALATASA